MSPEEIREKQRLRAAEWRSKNRDKAREISRRGHAKRRANPEAAASIREYQKGYREKNRAVLVERDRERRFGITRAEYADLFHAQNGVCAICEKPETEKRGGKVKTLAVDHNHSTGEIRGLLCVACNTGIGKLKDDRNILLSAIRYLDRNSAPGQNVVPIGAVKGS